MGLFILFFILFFDIANCFAMLTFFEGTKTVFDVIQE